MQTYMLKHTHTHKTSQPCTYKEHNAKECWDGKCQNLLRWVLRREWNTMNKKTKYNKLKVAKPEILEATTQRAHLSYLIQIIQAIW